MADENQNQNQSSLGGLAGVASVAGGLAGLASVPAQYYMNKAQAKQQQAWTEQNMQKMLQNQHELNRSATPEAVQGLRDAGLSPALMNGPMNPSSASAGPQGAKPDSVDIMGNLAMAENMAQDIAVKSAQTDLINQQAEEQKLINNRMKSEDKSWQKSYLSGLNDVKTQLKAQDIDTAWIDKVINDVETNDDMNLGDLQGSLAGLRAAGEGFEAYNASLEKLLDRSGIIQQMFNFKEGSLEYQLAKKDLALKGAILSNTEAELPAIEKQSRLVQAQIHQAVQSGNLSQAEANKIKNSDPYSAFADGEYGKGALILGGRMLEKGAEGTGQIIGLGVGGKVAGVGKMLAKPVAKKAVKSSLSKVATSGAKTTLVYSNPFKKGSANFDMYRKLCNQIGPQNADNLVKRYLASGRKTSFSNFVRNRK